ncbi:MAG: hypothetical protein DLM67_15320 [Candidatus Nephthysia bennettiae]|uniref:Flp pilus-assembly TadG-like N-terminal domain-containing protein n=1 Tax=Candidatus Nephthysia bennettiae TaxID=3127016 RepID=A0A934N7J9_9BACT|nr:hypothetical protein [Candidatus Dormibacteraeota bacterium]MBJ7614265.1 hypothetical protein [Candidatus Dormibacteraeota bacterium]PZR92088.1 MAG: hypothetical protein DLM67_15320 [Candidatus Dormibacteraeota bacterium]
MRPGSQSAQTLVVFALTLALFFSGMIVLVADAGALFVAYNRIDSAALLAVQSGASAIDANSFYAGSLRLDQVEAERRCRESFQHAGVSGSCRASGRQVAAEARQAVQLPLSLFGAQANVRVLRTALPAYGGTSAT